MLDYKITRRLTIKDIILHDVLFVCALTYMCVLAFFTGYLIGQLLFGV
jgi:hypothetical protein